MMRIPCGMICIDVYLYVCMCLYVCMGIITRTQPSCRDMYRASALTLFAVKHPNTSDGLLATYAQSFDREWRQHFLR
jgi:hypothetical protein